MKKQLVTSLMMVTLIGLVVPVSVIADEETNTESTTQYSSEESSTSSATVQPGVSNLVLGNQFGYTQNEVIVGTNDGSSPMLLPKIKIGSANTSITVLNPSPEPVSFSVPALNMTAEVPANGARVIQIDKVQAASLTPGQEVAYYINDSDGNQIASSSLVNNQEIASMIDINTQVATTEETTTTTSYQQTTTPAPESRSAVRGYW